MRSVRSSNEAPGLAMTDKPTRATPAELIKAKTKPDVVDVPSRLVMALAGAGPPEAPEFAEAVGALYGVAYTMRFARKKTDLPVFKVGVLEGEWWAEGDDLPVHDVPARETWRWRVMMAVPGDATSEELEVAVVAATTKRGGKLEGSAVTTRIELLRLPATRYARILHRGPYATEPESFAKIADMLEAMGLERERRHLEVYLSDPQRTAPEKLRTALLTPLARHSPSN